MPNSTQSYFLKTSCASESHEKLFKNSDVQHLNVRAKTIKLLEENLGINLHDLGLGNRFLDMTPKVQTIKQKIDN